MYNYIKNQIIGNEFSYKTLLKWKFQRIHKYKLDLESPKTFSEKIQFRNVFGNHTFMSLIADKYKVREYVKSKVGGKYLIPLLGVFNKISIEDIEQLSGNFIIKANHASGPQFYRIFRDEGASSVDTDNVNIIDKLNNSLKWKMGNQSGEMFYNLIEPKLIAEKLLLSNGKIPNDYKFHCFNTNGQFNYILQVDFDRSGDHTRSLYNSNFEELDFVISYKKNNYPPDKLINSKEMVDMARILSQDFDYIRVDLYNVDGKIYFGELTQTHGCGFEKFNPTCWDKKIGELWEIDASNELLYRKINPLNRE